MTAEFRERPGARAAIARAVAEGVGAIAERVAQVAKPRAPDDPKTSGSRIRESVNFAAYLDGAKIAGEGDPGQSNRPGTGIVAIAGAGFPGRFQETGTVNMAANPFLGPAAAEVVSGGEAARVFAEATNARLARER